MITLISNLFSVLLSVAILVSAQGFFVSFLSLYFQQVHDAKILAGIVHSAYFAGLVCGAWQVERLIMRVGHIRAYAFFSALSSASCLLMGLFPLPWFWVLARFIGGVCIAGQLVVFESWMLDKSDISLRGRALALYSIVYCFFLALGQFYLEGVKIEGIEPFIIFSLFTTLSILPLCYTSSSSPDFSEPHPANLVKLLRASPLGVVACFISGVLLGSLYSFMPMFGVEKKVQVSLLLFLLVLGGGVLQWPFGWLSDVIDRRKLLVSLCFLGVLPVVAFSFFSTPWILYTAGFLIGGVSYSIWLLAVNCACDRVEQKSITAATAALLLVYGLGCMVGPFASGNIVALFHFTGLFVFFALLFAGLGIFGLATFSPSKVIPVEEQVAFVPLTATTPVMTDLDPRQDAVQEEAP
jgi:MFS family permease